MLALPIVTLLGGVATAMRGTVAKIVCARAKAKPCTIMFQSPSGSQPTNGDSEARERKDRLSFLATAVRVQKDIVQFCCKRYLAKGIEQAETASQYAKGGLIRGASLRLNLPRADNLLPLSRDPAVGAASASDGGGWKTLGMPSRRPNSQLSQTPTDGIEGVEERRRNVSVRCGRRASKKVSSLLLVFFFFPLKFSFRSLCLLSSGQSHETKATFAW